MEHLSDTVVLSLTYISLICRCISWILSAEIPQFLQRNKFTLLLFEASYLRIFYFIDCLKIGNSLLRFRFRRLSDTLCCLVQLKVSWLIVLHLQIQYRNTMNCCSLKNSIESTLIWFFFFFFDFWSIWYYRRRECIFWWTMLKQYFSTVEERPQDSGRTQKYMHTNLHYFVTTGFYCWFRTISQQHTLESAKVTLTGSLGFHLSKLNILSSFENSSLEKNAAVHRRLALQFAPIVHKKTFRTHEAELCRFGSAWHSLSWKQSTLCLCCIFHHSIGQSFTVA